MKHNFAKSIMMMLSQEMLHKISASLAQCHVKGELDLSLRSTNSALTNLLGRQNKISLRFNLSTDCQEFRELILLTSLAPKAHMNLEENDETIEAWWCPSAHTASHRGNNVVFFKVFSFIWYK